MTESELLKKDLFGEIRRERAGSEIRIVRDTSAVSPWLRWLARLLLRREARVLTAVSGIDGVPRLLVAERDLLARSYLPGAAMQVGQPRNPAYFAAALRLFSRRVLESTRFWIAVASLSAIALTWVRGPPPGSNHSLSCS